MATLIRADGRVETVVPAASATAFTLPFLQETVGGYIESIGTPDGRVMILNEDGKRLQLPYNARATTLMVSRLRFDDYIVGDVLICSRTELGEDETYERWTRRERRNR